MNMKPITRALGIVALMLSANVFAQTQVPNTFQAGQPALAAEVNDNFSTLETAVNSNAAAIRNFVLIDANQTEVGLVQNLNPSAQANFSVVWLEIGVNTVPLYAYKDLLGNAQEMFIFYDGAGCTGTAIVRTQDVNNTGGGLFFLYDYFVHSDGQTLLQLDTSTTIATSWQSYEKVGFSGTAWAKTCFAFPGSGNAHPAIVVGTLPVTTPPYSVKLVSN